MEQVPILVVLAILHGLEQRGVCLTEGRSFLLPFAQAVQKSDARLDEVGSRGAPGEIAGFLESGTALVGSRDLVMGPSREFLRRVAGDFRVQAAV